MTRIVIRRWTVPLLFFVTAIAPAGIASAASSRNHTFRTHTLNRTGAHHCTGSRTHTTTRSTRGK